jgi:hypothetical protein
MLVLRRNRRHKLEIEKNQLLLSLSTGSKAVSMVSLEILTEPKARNVDRLFSIRNPSGTPEICYMLLRNSERMLIKNLLYAWISDYLTCVYQLFK